MKDQECPGCFGAGSVYCIGGKTNPCGLCKGKRVIPYLEAKEYLSMLEEGHPILQRYN